MLTSCPTCGTTFRISSAELRVAEGLARCGSCGETFNALLTLADDSATPQYGPVRAEPAVAPGEPVTADESGERFAPQHEPAPDRAIVEQRPDGTAGEIRRPADDRVSAGDHGSPGDWDIGDTIEQPVPPMRAETDDEEAGTPVYLIDDWTGGRSAPAPEPATEALTPDRDTPSAESFDSPGQRPGSDWAEDEPRGFYFENGEARAARAWRPARELPDEPDFATPAPPRRGGRAWGLGTLLLIVLLGFQLIHAQRDALATQPGYGQLVRAAYGSLKLELYPAWPLSAYEITESEAVVAGGATRGALDILGTIAVQGSEAVGAPLVRVTLRDRWSNALGERLLEARDYASGSLGRDTLLQPGSTLPMQISLMDPGAEAIGYELDICIRYRQLGLRCQVDADPFVE